MLVLYGSQTGTAQDVAELLTRKLTRQHLVVRVFGIDSYPLSDIVDEKCIIFIVATTGQGDPPDNMKNFWKLLWRKNLTSDCFSNLTFSVAGLGDSSYQKYNFVAKKLHKRLVQLGGRPILPCLLADDQHPYGYYGDIYQWLNSIIEKLIEIFPKILEPIPDNILLPPKHKFSIIKKLMEQPSKKNDNFLYPSIDARKATVISNDKLTAVDHWQDVRLITLRLSETIKFEPGDVGIVWPKNSAESVKEFLSLLKIDGEAEFVCEPNKETLNFNYPTNCSMHYLVENFLDINGPPRGYFWELMHHFASDNLEKEKFEEFLTLEGQEELFSYCHRPKRTILEILNDFHLTVPNIDHSYLLDLIPIIRPRQFSIASFPNEDEDILQLLVAVVEYKTRLKQPRLGLCSNFLAHLNMSDDLFFNIKKTLFKFPMEEPLIMIGPGTGVAPFRSIIQYRTYRNIGDNYLFFGCRNREKDFFFEEEWKDLQNQHLLKVFTAFSRDQDDKIYVQHIIKEKGELVWSLLQRDACIYIAGSSKNMPDAVHEALTQVITSFGGMTADKAIDYLDLMQKKKKYQLETWS